MADVTIANLTAAPLLIQDLYTTIPANGTITVSRHTTDLARMSSLQAAVAANQCTVAVVLTATETASTLVTASIP
jgi:hypothetical protein